MPSCNLRNLFPEVWKLAQMYPFGLGLSFSLRRVNVSSLHDKRRRNVVDFKDFVN